MIYRSKYSTKLHVILLFICCSWLLGSTSAYAKTVVLGFDGMDPVILEKWMSEGHLPHFTNLKEKGFFAPLETTNPAQSPVAWSTFATGLNPGEHGIFDFIHRNPETMGPDYSISGIKTAQPYEIFDTKLPYNQSIIYNKRVGKPFWLSAEQMGQTSSVLRVPATYPPDNISHMLAGMGVPDLLGTQGTFSYYSTKYIDPSTTGGRIIRVSIKDEHISTELSGPNNPLSSEPMTIPIEVNSKGKDSVGIVMGDHNIVISEGDWSQWLPVKFKYGGFFSVNGMVRIHLEEAFPRFKMYVSPINVDPQNPIVPISSPPQFAADLSDEIGLFHTLGMPEETWSLNDGLIDDDTYLDMVKTILAEREAMFFHELNQPGRDLVVGVFVQTDRVSHMFWRGYDENHPGYSSASETAKNAMLWIYQEADRILGQTMQQISDEDRLIVLSDHGFAPYYYHVNTNKWLLDNGYLVLKNNATEEAFEAVDVDWSKTSAYAMGLNGIYANLAGREAQGWLNSEQADEVIVAISESIRASIDPLTQKNIVRATYTKEQAYEGSRTALAPDLVLGYERGYRASWQTVLGGSDNSFLTLNNDKWSGDHCIDPVLVPGIILTNFTPSTQLTHIKDIATEVLQNFEASNSTTSEPLGLFNVVYSTIDGLNQLLLKAFPAMVVVLIGGLVFVLWQFMLIRTTHRIKRIGFSFNVVRWVLWFFSALILLHVFHLQRHKINVGSKQGIAIMAIASVETTLPQLQWTSEKTNLSNHAPTEHNHNHWLIHPDAYKQSWKLIEADGSMLYELSDDEPMMTKPKPSWIHHLISNPSGYLHHLGQIDKIKVFRTDDRVVSMFWFVLGAVLAVVMIIMLKYLRPASKL